MRSNYSREERQKIVEEYIQSGKSQTVFAPEWLLEKKQKEMILDSSKTKVVMEQEHPALLRVYYKLLKRRSQGCKRKRALTRRILSLIEKPIRIF